MTHELNNDMGPDQPHDKASSEKLFRALSANDVRKTAGEAIHNEITYRGVDWIANATIGVSMAYFGQRFATGRRFFARPIEGFWSGLFSPIVKNSETLAKAAEKGATFTGIALGGVIIIPPMQLLEKNKRNISEWIDEKVYGKERIENDPRFAIRYEAVEQRPEKNFWAGMASRFTVLTPMIVTVMFADNFMKKAMYQPIGYFTKGAAKRLKLEPEWMKRRDAFKSGQNDWDFLHDTMAMDFGLSFIYAYAHEYTYKKMNKDGILNFFVGGKRDVSDVSADPHRLPTAMVKPAPELTGEKMPQESPSPIIKADNIESAVPVAVQEQAVQHG